MSANGALAERRERFAILGKKMQENGNRTKVGVETGKVHTNHANSPLRLATKKSHKLVHFHGALGVSRGVVV